MNDAAQNVLTLDDEVEKYIRERDELEISAAVPGAVSREEELRFRQLKWLVALVGLIGLGTFGTLSNHLIEKAVEARLEARTGNISDSLEFIRFNSIALKLDLGTSFSSEDKAAIMNYLRRAARNDRARHTTEFTAALVQVVRSFAQAGQSSSIDELYQLYERELLGTDTLVEILLHHYGQQVVARPVVPKEDYGLRVFERLEALAHGAKVPELALAYRVLYQHRQRLGSPDPAVLELLARAHAQPEADLRRFFREILERTIARNWQTEPDPMGLAFEQVTRGFLRVYAPELAKRVGAEADLFVKVADRGIDKDQALELAGLLARKAHERAAGARTTGFR